MRDYRSRNESKTAGSPKPLSAWVTAHNTGNLEHSAQPTAEPGVGGCLLFQKSPPGFEPPLGSSVPLGVSLSNCYWLYTPGEEKPNDSV